MQSTEFHPIPGFEGIYSIDANGRVFSEHYGRVLKGFLNNGYWSVDLHPGNGRPRNRQSVHRLVALTFHGEPTGPVVRHMDGDPMNNHADNLRYGTYADNTQDMLRHGNNANENKTSCKWGHEYTEANTGRRKNVNGRYCRRCNSDRVNAIYHATKTLKTKSNEGII